MAQQPVEIILLRQWAEMMASPVWIMDAAGNLLYYNEPAEMILGQRFAEAGEVHADHLADMFLTTTVDGTPLESSQLPIGMVLAKQQPAHDELRIRDRRGEWHQIEVMAVPLVTADHRMLGVMAMFWDVAR